MKALCFGEILWDITNKGATLGGAPLNVAGHIKRLGGESIIVSALGDDEAAKRTLQALSELGLDSTYVKTSQYATGYAEVKLAECLPSYTFNTPAAWDDIVLSEDEIEKLSSMEFDAVIFGTLASRLEKSRKTLFTLLERLQAKEFFFDVNLRLSYYSDDLIAEGIKRATILKINDEEVPIVARSLGVEESKLTAWLFENTPVCRILITRGKQGSDCYEEKVVCHVDTVNVKVVDTVGAGDSLSAAFLFFLSSGLETGPALMKASKLADYVVTQSGAIPPYSDTLKKELGLI